MRRVLGPLAIALCVMAAMAASVDAQVVYTSLSSLHAGVGEDPRATYGRISIPRLGVDAALSRQAVTASDAILPNPYGPGDVAWYDFEDDRFGGAPGTGGNVVLSGHVDYSARVPYADGVRYSGPGVLARLDELVRGDVIEVRRDQRTYRYEVVSLHLVGSGQSDEWTRMVRRDVDVESLTLYTCDGLFNPVTRSYDRRYVVRAEIVEGTPNRFAAPISGRFSVGISGTTSPLALIAAQRWHAVALYGYDERRREWLTYREGAPAFANTLQGWLRTDSVVIIQFDLDR